MSDAPKLTARTCRWCGKPYVAPKGERWAGCRKCQPTLYDAAGELPAAAATVTPAGVDLDTEPASSPREPDPPDEPRVIDWDYLMCNWCRARLADATLADEPLCFDCVELILERGAAVQAAPALREVLPPLRDR